MMRIVHLCSVWTAGAAWGRAVVFVLTLSLSLSLSLTLSLSLPATAQTVLAPLSERELVELSGQGRYDDVAQRLAPREAQLKPGELHALCHAYARTKRYRPLLTCLDRLEAGLRGRDRASILFGLDDATPTVYLMRAEALLDLGQVQAAATQAERARLWFEREGSAGERDIQVEAWALLALAAARQQDPARANGYLSQIEAVKPGLTAGPNLLNQRTLGLARGHLALGQYAQACTALQADRQFEFRRSVEVLLHGNPRNWVWQQLPRLYMLAKCQDGQGQVAQAKAAYDELLRLPALRHNSAIHWMVLVDRSRIAEAEGEPEAAITGLRAALAVIEELRTSIDTEAAKIGFVADKQTAYGALISLLLAQNRATEALEVVERAKARALVDLLADRQGVATTRAVLARGDARLAVLLERQREAEETLQTQKPLRSEATWLQERNQLSAATAQLHQAAPELASLVSAAPFSAGELVRLLDADEVGLQYYLHGERLFALSFSAQGSRAYALDGKGLIADIRDFRAAIVQRTPQALVLGQKLYGRLIAPLENALGSRAVLVVPHSGLHYLPFAALHDGKRYLLDKHALRVTTSASALKYLRHSAAAPGTAALILGNPTGDLPSAEQEARRLNRLLPGSTLLLGAAATRQALMDGAVRARTLHIASHAVFDARQPLESRLILAPTSATAVADASALRVGDIYGLNLSADLVTLSACETGLGQITDGGEVIGITRGFLYAGASTVVASLWQVADEATATLMERFYANLARMNKRDALRAAQLELAKRSPQPYFWASFYLSGSSN